MIVLVTGGRDFTKRHQLYAALDHLREQSRTGMLLVEGHCRTGADMLARVWYLGRNGTPGRSLYIKSFPADWQHSRECAGHAHTRHGSGPCRNGRMVSWVAAHKHPTKLVLACPGGTGTADCVAKARAAGLTVKTIDEVLSDINPNPSTTG